MPKRIRLVNRTLSGTDPGCGAMDGGDRDAPRYRSRATRTPVETGTRAGKSPVEEVRPRAVVDPKYVPGTEEPGRNQGGPPPKARDRQAPIAQSTVRER